MREALKKKRTITFTWGEVLMIVAIFVFEAWYAWMVISHL